MLQHVTLEVRPDLVRECVAFWALLGFTEMVAPPSLRDRFTWVEREGTQIHLNPLEDPIAAREGHVAVVAPELRGRAARADRGAASSCARARTRGTRRASFVRDPAGHLVEVMSAPPHGPCLGELSRPRSPRAAPRALAAVPCGRRLRLTPRLAHVKGTLRAAFGRC